ncbi:MAG: Phosphoribosylaminoimidazole-succinocarboxamide synthase [Flavobacteriales bacterium]|jgi:phosphoribosylaminoimidazole-succinocarboxamide synthase|nr:MAG: phosphoribosylaminoimidazolesuccinocarboxamide synthase [Flavobacteriales bacterium]CAI8269032.1 MAG: Phosphoribosylaminoimidazole-succinocarboxamide synthase [Flavobacteriales bacterium]|tara:strand:- start:554 stop:1501 length:948 start_codon:yes stop_codon:yes gene_type:complete
MQTLMHSDLKLTGVASKYKGKVREVYALENDMLVMVATDRLSAFDVVMPKGIPYKGQILNQIAAHMLKATADIVPNWLVATPDPNVAVGKACEPLKVEMVIRGYLAGHAAREYALGKRTLCGANMPDGMRENDAFPEPIITPATKAEQGDHDEDITPEELIERGIVTADQYDQLADYTRALFARGTEMAKAQGLILVDTKYEFGRDADGTIVLIDEIHTPDSSRYFYADGYQDRQDNGEPQRQLSKEFVRRWLIENGFQGKAGQQLPVMSDAYIESVSERYIELYEHITGNAFQKADLSNVAGRIQQNLDAFFKP